MHNRETGDYFRVTNKPRTESVKVPTLFDAAKSKGYRTASLFWPESRDDPALDHSIPFVLTGDAKADISATDPAFLAELRENDVPIEMFVKGSFRYFGAPVAVFVTMDQSLGENTMVAVGAAVQNLLLAACDKGLGTCWIGMALMYSREIRETLGLPSTERIITSLALGYPDDEAPINSFKSTRDGLDSFVEWIGWE